MSSYSLFHQTTCAFTPQQNGVAKRKDKHLSETTQTPSFVVRSSLLSWYVVSTNLYMVLNRLQGRGW